MKNLEIEITDFKELESKKKDLNIYLETFATIILSNLNSNIGSINIYGFRSMEEINQFEEVFLNEIEKYSTPDGNKYDLIIKRTINLKKDGNHCVFGYKENGFNYVMQKKD
jgi:hypothetical protein